MRDGPSNRKALSRLMSLLLHDESEQMLNMPVEPSKVCCTVGGAIVSNIQLLTLPLI